MKTTLIVLSGGVIGAAVGCGIWYAAASWMVAGLPWLACLVGLTAGIGVRLATPESERGILPGLTAVAIAFVGILLAKHEIVIVVTEADPEVAGIMEAAHFGSLEDSAMIAKTADEIALEREANGQPVEWPEGMTYEEAMWEDDYPPELWAEATERWEGFSPEKQSNRRDDHEEDVLDNLNAYTRQAGSRQFRSSFSPLDIIWFLIAAFAAFRLPAGRLSEL